MRLDRSFDAGTFSVQYNNYKHAEIESLTGEIGTAFKNNTFLYQGLFDQRKTGRLSGRFGFWGMHRDFAATGEEALAPPTKQNAFAVFGLETFDFERVSLQFGGRLENNRYNPDPSDVRGILLRNRSFTGFSGAAGVRVGTWKGGAFVANYSHSYRAPALEELYNLGPHPGNLAFEIGDPDLKRELGDGIDFGLRHSSKRLRFEANGFITTSETSSSSRPPETLKMVDCRRVRSGQRRVMPALRPVLTRLYIRRSGSISDWIT